MELNGLAKVKTANFLFRSIAAQPSGTQWLHVLCKQNPIQLTVMGCMTCAITYGDPTPPVPGEFLCVRPLTSTPRNPAYSAVVSWSLIFITVYFTGEVRSLSISWRPSFCPGAVSPPQVSAHLVRTFPD